MKLPRPFRFSCVVIASGIATASSIACADEAPTSGSSPSAWQAAFGVAALSAPRYAGSNRTFTQLLPLVSVQKGPWFIDTFRGIGGQYQTAGGFSVSEALNYDLGRRQSDSTWRPGSRTLQGMGNIPGSVVSRTVISQQFNSILSASGEAEFSLKSGTHRARYRAGIELALIQRPTDVLTLDADLHGGNAAFNTAYFGVSPLQSARTRFALYKADGGLFAYSGSVTWTHIFSPRWSTTVIERATRYMGKADDSPIVQRHTALSTILAVNYAL